MKLITRSELSRRTDSELTALVQAVSTKLVQAEASSATHRNARASLENIRREQGARRLSKPGPSGPSG